MSRVDYFGVVKQQLWDYYQRMNEHASSLGRKVEAMDPFTGATATYLFIPSGLKSEIDFTREEIERWISYERNL